MNIFSTIQVLSKSKNIIFLIIVVSAGSLWLLPICCQGWLQQGGSDTSGAQPIRMQSESACKPIKSLLSLLTQWTWSSSTSGIPDPCSAQGDKHRLSDHLMCRMCTHTRARESERGSNASIWQHFEGSYRCKWSKCAPCNCTSRGSLLCRLDAVMSVADSICFSSFPLFFYTKTWFPYLPKALESSRLSFPISPSSSSSSSSANLSLPAQAGMMQITEKRQMSQPNTHVMGRNPLVSSLLSYSRLSLPKIPAIPASFLPYLTPAQPLFFFYSFFCVFLLLRTSHYCQRITRFGLSDVRAACIQHLLLWEF